MSLPAFRTIAAAQADDLKEAIIHQIRSLQANAGPTKQVVVSCFTGGEKITIEKIGFPTDLLVTLDGCDTKGTPLVRMLHINNVDIICRIVPVEDGKPSKSIGFVVG